MYLSLDRPDVMYSAKELCREFSAPTSHSVVKLKILVRYLSHHPRLVWHFKFEDKPSVLDVYSDTDVGGCVRTRRSTNGGAARPGTHILKCWSKTQRVAALGSAEAELAGLCQATG